MGMSLPENYCSTLACSAKETGASTFPSDTMLLFDRMTVDANISVTLLLKLSQELSPTAFLSVYHGLRLLHQGGT